MSGTRMTVAIGIAGVVAGSVAAIAQGVGWQVPAAVLIGVIAGAIASAAVILSWE